MNQDLLGYIGGQLKNGVSKEEISKSLMVGGGWTHADIDMAFATLTTPAYTTGNKLSAVISRNLDALFDIFVILVTAPPLLCILGFLWIINLQSNFFLMFTFPFLFFVGMSLGLAILITTDPKFSKTRIILGLIYGISCLLWVSLGIILLYISPGTIAGLSGLLPFIALAFLLSAMTFAHLFLLFKFNYSWSKNRRTLFIIFSLIINILIAIVLFIMAGGVPLKQ